MQRGLDRVWPYVAEIFDDSWLDESLVSQQGRGPAELTAPATMTAVGAVISEATLTVPDEHVRPRRRAVSACTPSSWATCWPSSST